MARLYPMFSGSSGNAFWFGNGDGGILIDAGVSAKKLTEALSRVRIAPETLQGIFITHEHIDHVRGLRVFLKKKSVPVYATAGTLSALVENAYLPPDADMRVVGQKPVAVGSLQVQSFATSHDCRESCGYTVRFPDGRSAALVTDLGYVSDAVRSCVAGKDFVIVESNHDIRMLQNGPYPFSLKQRILSEVGHLSNDACDAELAGWIRQGSTRILLAHLSAENNLPRLASASALSSLKMAGLRENIDFTLAVAPRENSSEQTILF